MFTLKNVRYKHIVKVDNLSIESEKITCILGKSGAGKTTLLKLLNKMITPDEGTIFFHDKPIDTIDSVALRRQVVMLAQTPSLYPHTVEDNLQIGRLFSDKAPVDVDHLKRMLQIVELNKALSDEVDTLSGGEKQRLALGRMLLMKPDVYLLDEPSASLDEQTANLIIKQVVEYTKKHQKTLIMITHQDTIAKRYADTIINMVDGQLVQGGGVRE